MDQESLKERVYEYWNENTCGTGVATARKYTPEYFDEIEAYRYEVEPQIFSFAQFSRFHDQRVLEVGIGAGTDFLQWIRSGAKAYGVDLTDEAVDHVRARLDAYGLAAEEIRVADAEDLPYPDDWFDLAYSWGVIHHTPDTVKALEEMIRVTRPGGTIKVMVYNRRSLNALRLYLRYGPLKGKPFRSIASILYDHAESVGTKAFTIGEIKRLVAAYSVRLVSIRAQATQDELMLNKPFPVRFVAYGLACLAGYRRCGWFLTFELRKEATS